MCFQDDDDEQPSKRRRVTAEARKGTRRVIASKLFPSLSPRMTTPLSSISPFPVHSNVFAIARNQGDEGDNDAMEIVLIHSLDIAFSAILLLS